MRILSALLAITLLASPTFAQTDWSLIATKLAESVVYVEGPQGSCTGWVINNEKDLIITAAHCDQETLFADLVPVKVQAKDVKNDFLILKAEGIDRPALKLAKVDAKLGDVIASYGYGWGLEKPLFRIHHVSQVDVQFPNLPGTYTTTDTTFVAGMSGGPVVNARGEVVMIVQRGSDAVGIGIPASFIQSKVGRYFEGGESK